jgi:NAD(P)-dependent dehydrogenase (short-subunit alcohol dehydrogenase family)
MPEKIGFVGVGRMGANMARRLKEVGYPVTAVYDVRKEAAEELAKEVGAEACTKLARVTELSDVVITVVTDDKAQLAIFTNAKDYLLQGAKGRVFVNCATISPQTHVQVEKLAKKAKAASARIGRQWGPCVTWTLSFSSLSSILRSNGRFVSNARPTRALTLTAGNAASRPYRSTSAPLPRNSTIATTISIITKIA